EPARVPGGSRTCACPRQGTQNIPPAKRPAQALSRDDRAPRGAGLQVVTWASRDGGPKLAWSCQGHGYPDLAMPNNITKLTLPTLRQRAQLGDRGRATLALAGPILASLLMSINHERADDAKNGRSGILLCQLAYFLKTDDDGAL